MGTYLITGATGGIGAAITELLRTRGHDLILAGRSADKLAEMAEPAADRTLVLDLSEPRGIEAALAEAALPEHLDGVVHSAGVADLGPVAEVSADQWIEQLMVNLAGAAELTRLLLPALRAAAGQVVFINSGAGLRANPGWAAYAASKHGLRALADALRAEEPELRVTTVYPGRTATEMQRKVRAQEGGAYEPESYTDPRTVACVVVNALETSRDAVITDVTVRS
jgi:short-subunit dehydrogenase